MFESKDIIVLKWNASKSIFFYTWNTEHRDDEVVRRIFKRNIGIKVLFLNIFNLKDILQKILDKKKIFKKIVSKEINSF